jgi:hypothetical protein
LEPLYQGGKDVFLVKVRADFDATQNQALRSLDAVKSYSLVDTDPMALSLFTSISDTTTEGTRAIWRHVGTTGVINSGTRIAGGVYPDASFIRTYETAIADPNLQLANRFVVPEEREMKEARQYKEMLGRAAKIMYDIDRYNVLDPFEVFNLGFTAAASQPARFFVRGNAGLDGNQAPLGERLYTNSHAVAFSSATTYSNMVGGTAGGTGTALPLSYVNYWTAKELGASFVDDVGKPWPKFGGKTCIAVPPKNGLALTAHTIEQSEWKPGVTDNDVNIVKGEFARIIVSPYLNDSFYLPATTSTTQLTGFQWFLVDESDRDPQIGTGLVRIDFVPLESRVERDLATDSIVYKIKEEYVYGFADWRGTIASLGTGAYIATA